ncbi:hypothetical protein COLO4_07694 [Corchorus olitorius]|uniref:Uncharacterized protein n=1 Tax=Corchorus olitorius TaxID=93759 RepID=A0A1R3KIV8_9ROSI|nr:hypothetical protein COLO4_07694 [Corchorus olitorius]
MGEKKNETMRSERELPCVRVKGEWNWRGSCVWCERKKKWRERFAREDKIRGGSLKIETG